MAEEIRNHCFMLWKSGHGFFACYFVHFKAPNGDMRVPELCM